MDGFNQFTFFSRWCKISLMRVLIVFVIFLFSQLSGMTLKEKFLEGEVGSYIVTEQNQLITLLHLHSKEGTTITFEEISIPYHLGKKLQWKEWVAGGAKGHTSWIHYTLDLEKGEVKECYSLSRKSLIPADELEAFLLPLISLSLKELSEKERLQVGASPKAGEVSEKLWGPPQVLEGKRVSDPAYQVYTARWPADSTELSGKPIVLYFDETRSTFPFPYWLQARDGAIKFKIRALDSGTGMKSKRL